MPPFFSPYRHEFVRVAACVPQVAVAAPSRNAENVLGLLADGDRARVALMVFPELCLSAYAIDDLLFQDAVLDAVERQIDRLICASRELLPVFVVGAPLRLQGRLYNCGVVDPPRRAARRRSQGVSAELSRVLRAAAFHLRRGGASAVDHRRRARSAVRHRPCCSPPAATRRFTFHVEICEDLVGAAAAERRGGARRRRDPAQPVGQQHRDRQGADAAAVVRLAIGALHRRLCLFGGRRRRVDDRPRLGRPGRHLRIGRGCSAETERFRAEPEIAVADVDLGRIRQERMRTNTFGDNARQLAQAAPPFRRIEFDFAAPSEPLELRRTVERFPFVPSDPAMLARQLLRGLQHPGPGSGAAA